MQKANDESIIFTRCLRNGFIYKCSAGYLRPKAVALSAAWRVISCHLKVQPTVNMIQWFKHATYPQHHIPWQTLQPWSSGNSEKIMITIKLPELRNMEGEVIEWQTLSNARRWCNFVFLLVSFQCVPLAVGRESSLPWDKVLFPFAVRDVAEKCNGHFGLEWWGEWLHWCEVDTVTSDLG